MKRLNYIYEIPIFYLLLHVINRLFAPTLPAFIGVEPHPYWLGIFLFGFRYGMGAGLFSGIVSSLIYLTFAWRYLDRYVFEDLSFYSLPVFFIVIGLLIGLGIRWYRNTISDLRSEKENLLGNLHSLKEEVKTVMDVNRELEKRVVTRMTTLSTLYEGARRLDSDNMEDLYPSLLDFVVKTLDVEEAAIYHKTEQGWEVSETYGWDKKSQHPKKLGMMDGITGMAGSRNRIMSVRDFLAPYKTSLDLREAPTDALLSGPLRRGVQGETLAVLSVQKMPLFSFNSAALNLFSFLLEWASRSIERTLYIAELKSQKTIDPELEVYSYHHFRTRAEEEIIRSKIYNLPLSVGLVGIDGLDSLPASQRSNTLLVIGQLLRLSSREIDVVARYPERKIPFAALWMMMNQQQAQDLKKRIMDNFSKLCLDIDLHLGISSLGSEQKDFGTLMMEARRHLEH